MYSRRASGFTLIELLVVVAIIALLISILLPSLKKARDQAKAAVCLSNLKAMGTALQLYKDDNRSFFPGDHLQDGRIGIFTWVGRLWRHYAGQKRELWDCPSTESHVRWIKLQTKGASQTPPPANVIALSTSVGYDNDEWPLMGDRVAGVEEYFSYGYNGYGGRNFIASGPPTGLGGHIKGEWNAGLPEAQNEHDQWEPSEKDVVRPSEMIAITDAEANGRWDATISPEDQMSFPGGRHNRGASVLFADAHAVANSFERLVRDDDVERRRWNRDYEPHPEWFAPSVPSAGWEPGE
ncbi:MAG: prepilin-type N-terminal cleavage/methylation domain-containing protein [Planctomycetes bacterium]|nr:prepilin-type N-terminal cleavage/methylation domain-containing protein [Planctomycetota bacterium]